MTRNFGLNLPPDMPRRPPVVTPHRLLPAEVVLILSATAILLLLFIQLIFWLVKL